jgi:hypothetical protein
MRVSLDKIPKHPTQFAVFTHGATRMLVNVKHVRDLLKLKKNKVTLDFDEYGLHCRWSPTGVYHANASNYGKRYDWKSTVDELAKYVHKKYHPHNPDEVRARLFAEVCKNSPEVQL